MKQAMTGYVPFGARRTMTQTEEEIAEEDIDNEKKESLRKMIRLLVIESLKDY
jgi:hypothetical protein